MAPYTFFCEFYSPFFIIIVTFIVYPVIVRGFSKYQFVIIKPPLFKLFFSKYWNLRQERTLYTETRRLFVYVAFWRFQMQYHKGWKKVYCFSVSINSIHHTKVIGVTQIFYYQVINEMCQELPVLNDWHRSIDWLAQISGVSWNTDEHASWSFFRKQSNQSI